MNLPHLLQKIQPEITDSDDETFTLFSQSFPSQDLGFVDPQVAILDIDINGRSLSISQSPGILSSNRSAGTTGAVLWRITPRFASWLTSPHNILFESKVLHNSASVIELGCGVSGILPLILGPQVGMYVATDQDYVFKLLRRNLISNSLSANAATNSSKPTALYNKAGDSRAKPKSGSRKMEDWHGNVHVLALDWEKSSVESLPHVLQSQESFDLVIACDCIYNEALIMPLVDTSARICRLRDDSANPTVCVIAQQLRSDEVFTAWLKAFNNLFRVWKVPDEACGPELSSVNGYAVHIGILRSCKIDVEGIEEM